jgi:hypothetical protein
MRVRLLATRLRSLSKDHASDPYRALRALSAAAAAAARGAGSASHPDPIVIGAQRSLTKVGERRPWMGPVNLST